MRPTHYTKWTPELIERAARLAKTQSRAIVAEALNVSKRSLNHHLRRKNANTQQKSR